MRRPAFNVVTGTVAILALVGFAAIFVRPHIPTPIENDLWSEESDFLSRAATQEVDWKKPTKEAFAQARRRDMPILLFIGNGYDPLARGLDQGVLMSPRIHALLDRNFECIRVDMLEHPEFRNAFLPLSKVRVGIDPGFQLVVLDPSGRIMHYIPTLVGLFPTDENLFARELVEARDRFEAMGRRRTELEDAQAQDLVALAGNRDLTIPPFDEYSALLGQTVNSGGGFGPNGPRTLTPEAWKWLLSSGQEGLFRDSLDPVLKSGAVDLIDGGFFHGSRDEFWKEIDMSKAAVTNAAMLQLMSSAAVLLGDPIYRYLAERTFDSLLREFLLDNGIAAYRPSDQGDDQRSSRASFGVRRLLEALPDRNDLSYAQQSLGLRVEENQRMVPRLANPDVLQDTARLNVELQKLRSKADAAPECRYPGFVDVSGYCVARMLESARILGDGNRLNRASDAFRWVELGRKGSEVVHNSRPEFHEESYAGDYLGYADAALQMYLATGKYAAIQSGRLVLMRCLEKFAGSRPGSLKLALDREAPFPWTESIPELYDTSLPSALSQAISLAEDYGRIFTKDTVFTRFANEALGSYGSAAFTLKERGAAFFSAARRAIEDDFFVTVGPKSQELADAVIKRQPFRLCVPAFGDIRPDIQARGSGVYVVRGENVRGPFDADEAARQVSPYLGAGP